MSAVAYSRQTSSMTAPTSAPTSDREGDTLVEVTITELISIEERLAHQAHLGDLHPAHARRLAAVTAELDRRWADHA